MSLSPSLIFSRRGCEPIHQELFVIKCLVQQNLVGDAKHLQRCLGRAGLPASFHTSPRYLAVLSILAWPRSARTVCKSPVPFKMWRAFVRRSNSTL